MFKHSALFDYIRLMCPLWIIAGAIVGVGTNSTYAFTCENEIRTSSINVVTENTVSPDGLTTPSFWWARKQFDPFNGKLLSSWRAYPEKRQVDFFVNRQLWAILDYVGRYKLVNQLGTVAREYKYNLRMFNQQQECLAVYKCDYTSSNPQCQIEFTPESTDGLQIEVDF